MPQLATGDIVISCDETGVVRSITSTAVMVLPARPKHGASKRWDVDLGVMPLSTISGPTVVNLLRAENWAGRAIERVGALSPAQIAACAQAQRRGAESARVEAAGSMPNGIFMQAQPRFKSGGRRVGGGARE